MDRPTASAPISALPAADADAFFAYLNDHLRDNGSPGTGYFQPLARDASRFPADREQAFREGLTIAVGTPGWRRAWVARSAHGRIVGHVDLRAHAEPYALHRCLLGIGVDRACRQAGLGAQLLAHADDWARAQPALRWIDLSVLSQNQAAIRLYRRHGFVPTGEVAEMFEIDGQRFALTQMSHRLGKDKELVA